MKSSLVAVFHGSGQPLTLERVAVPELRTGEILVRNEFTTLCRSDLHTYLGKRREKTPTILGHEIVGRIDELGPESPALDLRGAPLRVGDRITWAIYASDPASTLARQGLPQKADGLFKYGHELITPNSTLHGGLGEYCILRRHTPIIRIDAPVPLPLLAIVNCAVATVAGSLRVAGGVSDRVVVVAGAGMLGVVACAMCRVAGSRRIVAVDIDRDRLAMAKRFGAEATVDLNESGIPLGEWLAASMPGERPAVALDYSGVPETMEALVETLGVGGTAVFVGAAFPQRDLNLNAERLVRGILTLKGLHNYNARDLLAAVEFVERHHAAFPWADLVRGGFGLDQVNEAFEFAAKSGRYRVGIALVGEGGS